MLSKSTILHLRIPFFFYLSPFFLFACSQVSYAGQWRLWLSFLIIHFLYYPSSNGYNSYYDKDEESIGGLKTPPPVSKELLYTSVSLEILAILLATLISWQFSLMVFLISMVSRSYSHPSVRLKKFPIVGLITVALFQGIYTYAMSYLSVAGRGFEVLTNPKVLVAGALCTLMLFGSYPMTQVYQHGEDGRRGDQTISRLLGIRGTFVWAGIIFAFATAGFSYYFYIYYNLKTAIVFPAFFLPTLLYFFWWFKRVVADPGCADYDSTMKLNTISSICFNAFFVFLYFENSIHF